MKVTSTSSASTTASAGSASRPTADGFKVDMPAGGASAKAPIAGAAAAASVSTVDALLALQGWGGGPEARARALRKGRRILDALDRLQVALLGEGPTRAHLGLLMRAMAEQRDPSGDRELDETLGWAEIRAAVEAAKLERSAGLA